MRRWRVPEERALSTTTTPRERSGELSPDILGPALVTGGGSGMGRDIALALARRGCRVAICGRRRDTLEDVAREARELPGEIVAVAGDVSKADSAAAVVSSSLDELGGLRVLVNCAGVFRTGPLAEMTAEDVSAVVDVDLKGPLFVLRSAIPALSEFATDGGAAVVNVSSSVTISAISGYSVYSAAKAGLEVATRCLALELAPQRVRVNAVLPGVVRTPIFETVMAKSDAESFLGSFGDAVPLGRVGETNDVAAATLFLLSRQAEWITGALLPVDGGLSLGSP